MKKGIGIVARLAVAVGILVGIVVVVICVSESGSRTPATYIDVQSVLERYGYQPYDATEEWQNSGDVEKVLSVRDDENTFQLEFFTFSTEDQAHYVVQQFHSYISEHFRVSSNESQEMKTQVGNFTFYSRVAHDRYLVLTRIQNTVFFIHCADEERSEINAILKELGYLA